MSNIPSAPERHSNNVAVIVILGVLVLVLLGLVIALWMRGQVAADDRSTLIDEIDLLQNEVTSLRGTVDEMELVQEGLQSALDESFVDELPLVRFHAAGAIPDEDEEELLRKYIEPYIQYHTDAGKTLLVISIRQADNDTEGFDYPYSMNAYSLDSTHGALIERADGQIDWWKPITEMDVVFSDEFRELYPEIVEWSEGGTEDE